MRIERQLSTNSGEGVIVYIDMPKKESRENEFSCKVGVEGAGIEESTVIFGVDAMQAMMLAIRYIDVFVKRVSESIRPRQLIWEFGEKDDLGFIM